MLRLHDIMYHQKRKHNRPACRVDRAKHLKRGWKPPTTSVTVEGIGVVDAVQIGDVEDAANELFICKVTGAVYRTPLHAKELVKKAIRRACTDAKTGRKHTKFIEVTKKVSIRVPRRGGVENASTWAPGEYPCLYALWSKMQRETGRIKDPRSLLYCEAREALAANSDTKKKKNRKKNSRAVSLREKKQRTKKKKKRIDKSVDANPTEHAADTAQKHTSSSSDETFSTTKSPPTSTFSLLSLCTSQIPSPIDHESEADEKGEDIIPFSSYAEALSPGKRRNGPAIEAWVCPGDGSVEKPSQSEGSFCWPSPLNGIRDTTRFSSFDTVVASESSSPTFSSSSGTTNVTTATEESSDSSIASQDFLFPVTSPVSVVGGDLDAHRFLPIESLAVGSPIANRRTELPPPIVNTNTVVSKNNVAAVAAVSSSFAENKTTVLLHPQPSPVLVRDPFANRAPFSSPSPTMSLVDIGMFCSDMETGTSILCGTDGWSEFGDLSFFVRMNLIMCFKLHQRSILMTECGLTLQSFESSRASATLLKAIGYSDEESKHISDMVSSVFVRCDKCACAKLAHYFEDYQLERMREGGTVWCVPCCKKRAARRQNNYNHYHR